MQHVTHDFSEPDLEEFFDDDDTIHKQDLIHYETMVQFVVYWGECNHYPVNTELQEKWGISYRGNLLVMKRRVDGMRFAALQRTQLDQVMECVKWCVIQKCSILCAPAESLLQLVGRKRKDCLKHYERADAPVAICKARVAPRVRNDIQCSRCANIYT